MKNPFKTCFVVITLFSSFSLHANAQTTVSNTESYSSAIRLSVGVDGGIPVGSLNTGYNWNLGGSIQADFPIVRNQMYATLNSGYNAIFASSQHNIPDVHLIPVKAGLKYFIIKQLYIQGEAGVSFLTNKNNLGADNTAVFVYASQAGVLLNVGGKNYIDAGFRFESNQKFFNGGATANFLAIRVAYAFNL
jgi:hypothetical protein